VFADEYFIRAAAVLGGVGGPKVPFDVAGADDQGNVIEVDDLAECQLR
jgi:hypothetical protein